MSSRLDWDKAKKQLPVAKDDPKATDKQRALTYEEWYKEIKWLSQEQQAKWCIDPATGNARFNGTITSEAKQD